VQHSLKLRRSGKAGKTNLDRLGKNHSFIFRGGGLHNGEYVLTVLYFGVWGGVFLWGGLGGGGGERREEASLLSQKKREDKI